MLGLAYTLVVVSIKFPIFGLAVLAAGVVIALRQKEQWTSHGTARWAEIKDIPHLLDGHGIILGHATGKVSKWEGLKALFDRQLSARDAVQKCLASFQRKAPRHLVRLTNAVHTAVFAPSGAGKNVSIVEPFLLSSPENMLVVDVKGENATITAAYRQKVLGQKVALLDPFGVVTKTPATFNVLDTIDPDDPESFDQAKAIAEAIVVRQPGEKEPHWNDSAQKEITGVILAVVNYQPPGMRSLQDVARTLASRKFRDDAIAALRESKRHNGLLAQIGEEMALHRDKELDGILSTASRHLSFLTTPAVVESTLATTGFSLNDLDKGFSGYLILPPHYMRSHAGLMRLWVTAFMRARVAKGVGGRPLNVVLDEAASLGKMEAIDDMLTIGRGYSIKLLLIYQSMAQLKKCYPEGQDGVVLSNTTQVFFAVQDLDTAKYVSERMGDFTQVVSSGGYSEGTSYSKNKDGPTSGVSDNRSWSWNQAARRLLQPNEVIQTDARVAFTFHPGVPPLATRLSRYYENDFFPGSGLGPVKVLADTASLFLAVMILAVMVTAAILNP